MGAKNNKSDKGKSSATGPPAKDRFKTSKQLKQQIKDVKKVASGTAIKAGKKGEFLRDSQGNIVSYSGGYAKKKADAEKKAAELAAQSTIANPNLRPGTMTVSPEQFKARAEQELAMQRAQRDALMAAAKARDISSQQLGALARSNQRLGLNPTTGMGLGSSLRFAGQQIAQDLPGLAKFAGFIANPASAIATGLLTGGKGIASLAGDVLGGLKTKGQNVLAELRDEDIVGYTDQGTPVRVGQVITETDRPGFFEGITSALRLGEGAPFQERQFGGDQRGLRAAQLPILPIPVNQPAPLPIQNLPITTQPVTQSSFNEYLRLAGFNV